MENGARRRLGEFRALCGLEIRGNDTGLAHTVEPSARAGYVRAPSRRSMGLFDRFRREEPTPAGAAVEVVLLVAKLSATDWRERLGAARRLGELGAAAASAQAALEEATSDDVGEVCTAAADALAAIRRALHA